MTLLTNLDLAPFSYRDEGRLEHDSIRSIDLRSHLKTLLTIFVTMRSRVLLRIELTVLVVVELLVQLSVQSWVQHSVQLWVQLMVQLKVQLPVWLNVDPIPQLVGAVEAQDQS